MPSRPARRRSPRSRARSAAAPRPACRRRSAARSARPGCRSTRRSTGRTRPSVFESWDEAAWPATCARRPSWDASAATVSTLSTLSTALVASPAIVTGISAVVPSDETSRDAPAANGDWTCVTIAGPSADELARQRRDLGRAPGSVTEPLDDLDHDHLGVGVGQPDLVGDRVGRAGGLGAGDEAHLRSSSRWRAACATIAQRGDEEHTPDRQGAFRPRGGGLGQSRW